MKESTDLELSSGMSFLRLVAPFYFVVSAKLVADGVLRGTGMMERFMVTTFTDLILRVVLTFLLSQTALGYLGIWSAWPVGWTVAAVMSLLFYANGPWKGKKSLQTLE